MEDKRQKKDKKRQKQRETDRQTDRKRERKIERKKERKKERKPVVVVPVPAQPLRNFLAQILDPRFDLKCSKVRLG
jgi:hypothetical protein